MSAVVAGRSSSPASTTRHASDTIADEGMLSMDADRSKYRGVQKLGWNLGKSKSNVCLSVFVPATNTPGKAVSSRIYIN